ncbi:MAG: restriction endonuclease subunit S [Methylobacter sp.]
MTNRLVQLGDVADMLSGFAFKSQHFLDASEDGVKLVRGDNVQQGFIRWGDKTKKWRSDFYQDFQKYQLALEDVILAMDRPIVGGGLKLAWIKDQDVPSLLVQRVTRIRGLQNITLTNYLRYVLSTPNFVAYIDRITTGANIPHISGKEIARFEFTLPSLLEQERIVDLIGQYDDLIENNRRRIALLEESARLLYREWFVKLRFPKCSDHVSSVSSASKKWENWKVEQFGRVETGKTPSTRNTQFFGGDIPFIKTPDMHGNMVVVTTAQKLTESGSESQRNKLLPKNSVMVSCIGTVGVVSLMGQQSHTNQQINSVIPEKDIYRSYLYFTLSELKEYMLGLGGGSTMANISKSKFSSIEIPKPPDSLLQRFEETVAVNISQIEYLLKANLLLQSTRDELLPKLMSGAIQV